MPSFNKHQFEKTQRFRFSWRQIKVVYIFCPSFSWTPENTHRRLPKDLIILLISNYFKDKWVHLASKQTCQWRTRETVPSSLLSLGWWWNPFFFSFFSHIPTRPEFRKDFLLIAAVFLLFTSARRIRYYLSWHAVHLCSSFVGDIATVSSQCFLTCVQASLWLSCLQLLYCFHLWFGGASICYTL